MRRFPPNLLICVVSAVFGATAATAWWHMPSTLPALTAAEPQRAPDPARGIPSPSQPAAPNRATTPSVPQFAVQPAQAFDGGDELTPEERVNVAVYENCNKSVVNINTMATNTNLFLLDVVSEGAGSGSVLDRQGRILTNYH